MESTWSIQPSKKHLSWDTNIKLFFLRKYAETNSQGYKAMFKKCVAELREMTKPTAELSAVARNYIRNDPEEFIRNIAC